MTAAVSIDPQMGAQPARCVAIHAPRTLRRWASELGAALQRDGRRVRASAVGGASLPGTLDWLLYLERIAYRADASMLAKEAAPRPSDFDGAPDCVVDLAGDAPDGDWPTLRLAFDEGCGETGLIAALLSSRSPRVSIVVTRARAQPLLLADARLAIERPFALAFAMDQAAARLRTLLTQAVATLDEARDGAAAPVPRGIAPTAPLAFAARRLAAKIMERLQARVTIADHWRIALRIVGAGGGVMDRLSWPADGGWTTLPDDGRRYFADPFLFDFQGRRWLFCEEYPYATAKGILSVAEVGADGRAGAPRPILEAPTHLSWPQVFTYGGVPYMIPESAGAGRIELWRAVDFPDSWVLDRVLVEGVRAHDPLLRLDGRGATMLATLDGDGGSSWDALGLFHAPSLFGPWRAPEGPLFVDAGAARPAGPIMRRDGALWRPAQDCRDGYGAGLALCRVTRLDAGGYAQEVAARLAAPPIPGAQGVHTLSRLGSLEAIDWRGSRERP